MDNITNKPCINSSIEKNDKSEIMLYTAELLSRLGITPTLKGYRLLLQSVKLALENPERISAVTKLLYPELAKMNHTSSCCVERSIRNAIEAGYRKISDKGVYDEIGYPIRIYKRRPGNRLFIHLIYVYIRSRYGRIIPDSAKLSNKNKQPSINTSNNTE